MAKDNPKDEAKTQSAGDVSMNVEYPQDKFKVPFDTTDAMECEHLQVYHPVQADPNGSADQSWHIKRDARIFVFFGEQMVRVIKYERLGRGIRTHFCVPMSNVCWFRERE